MTAPTTEQAAAVAPLLTLVQAQASARQAIGDVLWQQVQVLLQGFTGWYDDRAVAALSSQIGRLVAASQRLTAASTASYLGRASSEITGGQVRPGGLADLSQLRAGVSPAKVYERLANQYRYELSPASAVKPLAAAAPSSPTAPPPVPTPAEVLTKVVNRAEVMVDTDVTLAMRKQAQRFMTTHQAIGYRRIIHPELSRTGTCGLCIAASDRVYKRAELMPVHGRCGCTVLPVVRGQDPAGVINNLDLARLYRDAGGTGAAELKKQRYSVNQHGELGPVLTAKGDAFRGPGEVAAAA